MGVISIEEALKQADLSGLDLVEVAPDANPPVCRIMDYGKYVYSLTKKEKEAKKKQHVIKVKEIKLRPNIEDHDYNVKKNQAAAFLEKGNKVKVTMMFRGREMAHMEFGKKVVEQMVQDLKEVGTVEMQPKLLGKTLIMVFSALRH